ncbi:hypothetical protein pEaSNUABM29_00250 [Erwinia phage pEa_SNUABM_29]|nr:hypothetical protein pEaSNUABM29_00250 [Erwinia phage pEa_SNUABM_29]
MKRFMLPILFASLAISFLVKAAAVELPARVDDQQNGGQFWCQNSDVKDGLCSIVSLSDNARYVLVKTLGGVACPDPQYGVVNLTTGKAEMMMYNDNQTCKGEAVAEFTRDPGDKTLTVILYDPTNKKNVGVNKINF